MLLSGMAGIGKTTLWNAGIQSATDHGYRVVTARPTEVETGLAFAALGDLLGPLLDAADARPACAATRGPRRRPAARLGGLATPAARRLAGGPQRPAHRGHPEGPIVVAIDDVPWLDEASARVLDFSIRHLDGGSCRLPHGAPCRDDATSRSRPGSPRSRRTGLTGLKVLGRGSPWTRPTPCSGPVSASTSRGRSSSGCTPSRAERRSTPSSWAARCNVAGTGRRPRRWRFPAASTA